MRILVLNGSPKKKSDTLCLTKAFLEGLNEENTHHVDIINVIDKQIAPCRGCFGCWQRGDGRCVQADDLNPILSLFTQADVIIWSFPLYCYGMPSHLKAVLDRTIPLVTLKMVEVDGRVQHVPLTDFSKMHHVVICGCGFPNWEGNFDGLRKQCETAFGNLTAVYVPETPLMNVPEAAPVAEPKLQRFREAGREYARSLTLSAETVQALEAPMIPGEMYINIVNAG